MTWAAALSLVRAGHAARDHPPLEFDSASDLPCPLARTLFVWGEKRAPGRVTIKMGDTWR
jgi:hypothetical protein